MVLYRIIIWVKYSQTHLVMFILLRGFYIASLNNYMFRPLYRPSSGLTLSYYNGHYKIYNVFVFVNEISCASIKFCRYIDKNKNIVYCIVCLIIRKCST